MENSTTFASRLRWFLLAPAYILSVVIIGWVAGKIYIFAAEWVQILFDWPSWWAHLVFGVLCFGAIGFAPVFLPSVYVAPTKNSRVAKILAIITILLFVPFYALLAYIAPEVADDAAEKWGIWITSAFMTIVISLGAIIAISATRDLTDA